MAKRIKLEGTTEEKFKVVERFLNRTMLTSVGTIKGIIPPIPMFNYIDKSNENGIISKHLLISDGRISKLGVGIEIVPSKEEEFSFVCKLERQDDIIEHTFSMNTKYRIIDIDIPVSAGDIVSMATNNPDINVGGISSTILYHIRSQDCGTKSFVMESILAEVEDIINASETNT